MATIKDVAKLAGVSVGTVSNVLNGRAGVSEKRAKKVWDAIARLEFHQNHAAKSLRTGTTQTLGLIIPDIVNPYYPEIARGVEDRAAEQGYNVLICNSDRITAKEQSCMEQLIARGVDGIIDVKPSLSADQIYRYSEDRPIVLVDSYYESRDNVSSIKLDFREVLLAAYNKAYDMGHRHFAYIGGGLSSMNDIKRFETFTEFVREAGLPENQVQVFMGSFSGEYGSLIVSQMVNSHVFPTIIFCASDIIAIGVLNSLMRNGVSVPDEVSVVGFDNIWASDLTTPRLTTIDVPKHELGVEAAAALLNKLNGGSEEPARETVPVSFLQRESMAACRLN